MAKRFLTSLRLVNLLSDPVSASAGDIYYSSSAQSIKLYNGSTWETVGSGGGGGGGGVTSVSGTSNEIDVSASVGNVIISLPNTINANTTGTAASLTTARTIALSGDVSGSASFDGSASAGINVTLANSGVSASTYGSASQIPVLVIDSKGRITSASVVAVQGGSGGETISPLLLSGM